MGMLDQRPPSKPRNSSEASVLTRPASSASRQPFILPWRGWIFPATSARQLERIDNLDLADLDQPHAIASVAMGLERSAAVAQPAYADQQRVLARPGSW